MSRGNLSLGKSAEDEAADFLRHRGYSIIRRNYRNRLGEIDIIARDKGTLCFVEVKGRRSLRCGLPQEAVSRSKRGRISRVALGFLKENNLLDSPVRFDVVALICSGQAREIKLIRGAFESEEGLV
ncbi:MAG: YraN family protein [Candidatus Omnitrophota bacterium]|jgi:putative endonuclease